MPKDNDEKYQEIAIIEAEIAELRERLRIRFGYTDRKLNAMMKKLKIKLIKKQSR